MKIDSSKKKNFNIPYGSKSNKTIQNSNNVTEESFVNILKQNVINNEFDNFNKELEQTVQELDAVVKDIQEDPYNEDLLKKYKSRLQRFIIKATDMYQTRYETTTLRKSGLRRKKDYKISTIQIINQEIEKLTVDMLKRESSRINLLEKFNLLKGLILDLHIDK
jgi:uncharacterized protein YaaR (DUF327 family)